MSRNKGHTQGKYLINQASVYTFSSVICGQDYGEALKTNGTCSSTNALNDTVGIICIDLRKKVMAVGCSSGGPEGKARGRVGPCALPGIGFWISENGNEAALCTGIGEQIAIKGGAKTITDTLSKESNFDEFLDSFYCLSETKLEFGFIAVSIVQGNNDITVLSNMLANTYCRIF